MPWNGQKGNGGGPWGGGGGGNGGGGPGPWGGGSGNNNRPPNPEEILRRLQDWLNGFFGDGGGGIKIAGIVALALVALWIATGIYRVLPDEQGVVLRFGAYSETTQPGLHYHLPSPIESVLTPKVTVVNTTEIGQQRQEDALMLTGDENIVDINLSVFWVIKDARDYLFNIQQPDRSSPDLTVKSAAESAVREVVGRTQLTTILQGGRAQVEADTQALLQKILDSYGAGIQITQVQLQKTDPPEQVIGAFRSVQQALTDKESAENEANSYRNDIVPRARGEATQIVQDAEAYKSQVVAKAQGDAERFLSVLNAYRVSKDVTAERLYLETMEQVMKNADKILIDKSAGGVVPYLPLPALGTIKPGSAATGGAPK
jgi:membrane protease subunit HflK